jgi:hypothetical protein
MMITYDALFIGGAWVQPNSDARIDVLSASTGEPIGSVPDGAIADIDTTVAASRQAFDDPHGWSTSSVARRAIIHAASWPRCYLRSWIFCVAHTVRRVTWWPQAFVMATTQLQRLHSLDCAQR